MPRRSRSSALVKLPTEILQAIFAQVQSPRGRLNVSLTCKLFLRANEPILYSEVSFKGGFPPKKKLQLFLRCRHLCKHVRSLQIFPIYDPLREHRLAERDVDGIPGELEFLSSLSSLRYLACSWSFFEDRMGGHLREDITNSPSEDLLDPYQGSALASFVAEILPASLKTLDLDWPIQNRWYRRQRFDTVNLVHDFVDAKIATPSRLPNLTTLVLSGARVEWIHNNALPEILQANPISLAALVADFETYSFGSWTPLGLGVRPQHAELMPMVGQRLVLRGLWKRAQSAGVQLQVADRNRDFGSRNDVGYDVCVDEDPFGLCPSWFGLPASQFESLVKKFPWLDLDRVEDVGLHGSLN